MSHGTARGRFPGAPGGAPVAAGRPGVGPVRRRGVVMAAAWAPGRVAPASGRPVSGRPVPGRVVGAVGSVSGRAVAVGSGGWARCRRGVEWPGAEGRSAHLGAVVPVSGRAVVAAVGGRASGPDRDVPGPDGDGPDGDADGPGFGWRSGRGRVAAGSDRPASPALGGPVPLGSGGLGALRAGRFWGGGAEVCVVGRHVPSRSCVTWGVGPSGHRARARSGPGRGANGSCAAPS